MEEYVIVNYLIVGASPAGCFLGKLLDDGGRGYTILDENDPGLEQGVKKLNIRSNTKVTRIQAPRSTRGQFQVQTDRGLVLCAHYLIIALDHANPLSGDVFTDMQPRYREDGTPILDGGWGCIDVERLYYTGTTGTGLSADLPTSAHLTGVGVLYRIMEHQHHQTPFLYRLVPRKPEVLARTILNRLEEVGAHTQPSCKTGDLIALVPQGDQLCYFKEVPQSFNPGLQGMVPNSWFTVRLEANTSARKTASAPKGHLILRHMNDGQCDSLILGLSKVWTREMLSRSLRAFFCSRLTQPSRIRSAAI